MRLSWHHDLTRLWEKYVRHSTLHGVCYVASPGATQWERAMWAAALLISAAGMASMSVPYVVRLIADPTDVIIDNNNLQLHVFAFPALSLCPSDKVRRLVGEQILLKHLGLPAGAVNASLRAELLGIMLALSDMEIPSLGRMAKNLQRAGRVLSQLRNFNITEFMMKSLPRCEDLFEACFWHNVPKNCCEILSLQQSSAGFCYSFNSLTSLRAKGCDTSESSLNALMTATESISTGKDPACELSRTTAFGSGSGLQVFLKELPRQQRIRKSGFMGVILHHNTHFPAPQDGYVMRHHQTRLAISFKVENTVADASLFNLPQEKRRCLRSNQLRLKVYGTYTRPSCVLDCRLEAIFRSCRCLPYMFGRPREPYCDATQLQCLTNIRHITQISSASAIQSKHAHRAFYELNCPQCTRTCQVVSFANDFFSSSFDAYTVVNSTGMVDVFNALPKASKLYTMKSRIESAKIFSYLGSVASLCFGMSILSVVETFYYLGRMLLLLVAHAVDRRVQRIWASLARARFAPRFAPRFSRRLAPRTIAPPTPQHSPSPAMVAKVPPVLMKKDFSQPRPIHDAWVS